MKMKIKMMIVSLLVLITSACVHNNGNIGPLFGTWGLDAMIVDGVPETHPEDANTFIMFQSNVVKIHLIDSRSTFLGYCYGSWERDGDVLELDFTHFDNKHEPGTGVYAAPAWLHFVPKGITTMRILKLKGGNMEWEQTTPEGEHIKYYFHKTF